MSAPSHITPELFAFLRELQANNDRDWFNDNKQRYLDHVRDPMLAWISDFAAPLAEISRHFMADPRPVGGSLFRIYRDARFAKDKSPYKTNVAVQLRHKLGKDVHAPGFYLSLAPGEVYGGAGIWHPDASSLKTIREAIVARPQAWKKAVGGDAFRDTFELGGDSLKRGPKGFDLDHPLIEDLKRKDFVAMVEFSEAEALEPGFTDRFAECCRIAAPMTRFLTRALDLEW